MAEGSSDIGEATARAQISPPGNTDRLSFYRGPPKQLTILFNLGPPPAVQLEIFKSMNLGSCIEYRIRYRMSVSTGNTISIRI